MSQDHTMIEVAQFLISHVCHELVSPVGAINNGVELLEENGSDGLQRDALELIAQSGRKAAAKLRFYRMAYGRAGTAADLRLSDVRSAIDELFTSDGRVALSWLDVSAPRLADGGAQLLLNLTLLAASSLPRGGTVAVDFTPLTLPNGVPGLTTRFIATGPAARVAETTQAIIETNSIEFDHRTAHAYLCRQLIEAAGSQLKLSATPDRVEFLIDLPLADDLVG